MNLISMHQLVGLELIEKNDLDEHNLYIEKECLNYVKNSVSLIKWTI